ncbi:hypothetical protein E1A91_D12G083900v1 [Gossypium mustelinum]|uniref:Uncharacterized protein n=1 Tax=Gossypium mustelinum TaxID=34275 RepID=A0A5D2SBB5_GOSMU|nr:hypothetical protein E1A91_D12G083900v1 [Gossypium mustelinum]
MKNFVICFALINIFVVQVVAFARNGVTYIHPWVLDPCKRPSRPHLCCHPRPKSAATQANTYNRGCSRHHGCRQGGMKV